VCLYFFVFLFVPVFVDDTMASIVRCSARLPFVPMSLWTLLCARQVVMLEEQARDALKKKQEEAAWAEKIKAGDASWSQKIVSEKVRREWRKRKKG
jgi:hypothetical protein